MRRLIIVSNRLPFKIDKKNNSYEIKQSSGGLVSALDSLAFDGRKVIWLGIADFKREVWNEIKEKATASNYTIEPLFVEKRAYNPYYNGFSNTMIWPLFHYFPSFAEYHEDQYESYKTINQEFANRITKLANEDDLIWIQDYHLMLLPKYIKEKRPELTVGFFLHIPFPSYEIMKLIPEVWRSDILEGLSSSSVLGFHTKEYVNHFKKSLSFFSSLTVHGENTELVNNDCRINSYPISINHKKFSDAFNHQAVIRGRKSIKQRCKGSKIIFSVDRLDYTKGVINRLQAYENLLETHPEYREKIVFVINLIPSRDQISKYAERKKMIEENIGRINGMYGNIQWQPVVYQYRHLTFYQLLSFYTAADIALVTPLRDGMNLVAKEFVSSRKDEQGILILSEFAGAASELTDAILVNPNDLQATVQGLLQALTMTEEEQQIHMRKMRNVIAEYDVQKWLNDFVGDLEKAHIESKNYRPHLMTFDEKVEIVNAYQNAKSRLLLFDYDGTLVHFQVDPQEASPEQSLKELLISLNEQPENEVIVVSGRDAKTLEKWFSDTGISYVSEHGASYKKHNEDVKTFVSDTQDWKSEMESILNNIIGKYQGAFVEVKQFSVAIHYRGIDPSRRAELETLIRTTLLNYPDSNFGLIYGNMVIEVKCKEVSKGSFVAGIVKEHNYDFILAIGDDTTDEDMFAVLQNRSNCYTIKVGITPTKARCNLINVSSVISFLDQLSKYKRVTHPLRSE